MTSSTERLVRVGAQIAPQHSSYSHIRDTLATLEELGVDIAFNWDHFYPLSGDPQGYHFEGWSMLAAWAEQTSSLEFGALVGCNSYRNPDLLADMARTIDHISAKDPAHQGRFILGIGSGWFERDYREYGYDFGTVGSRLDALAEALPRIESRLARLVPPPTRKIPVLIGGAGEKKTLKMVARHADIWHSFANAETLRHKIAVLAEHCAAIGRDLSEIEISTGTNPMQPPSDGWLEELNKQHELGARLFTVTISGPKHDLTRLRELVAWRDSMNA